MPSALEDFIDRIGKDRQLTPRLHLFIPLCPRKCLGLLQCLFAGEDVRPQAGGSIAPPPNLREIFPSAPDRVRRTAGNEGVRQTLSQHLRACAW